MKSTRTLERERFDRATMRALDEHRTYRQRRLSGPSSVWDPLKKKLVRAATMLWVMATHSTPLTDNLAAYCAFVARELELNEALDLPADEEEARLCAFAPYALETLDALAAPLGEPTSDPVLLALTQAFDGIRGELLVARGDRPWTIAPTAWTVAA